MLRMISLILIAVGIVACGYNRCDVLRRDIQILREYAEAVELLRSGMSFEQRTLPDALQRAACLKMPEIRDYFQGLCSYLHGGTEAIAPQIIDAQLRLPITSLRGCTQTEMNERLLTSLIKGITQKMLRLEESVQTRCKSTMTLSLCVAAICTVVMI